MERKKRKFVVPFIIICNISILLCFIIGFILMFKFNLPETIDKQDFIRYMQNKGCSLVDIQKQKNYFGIETYLVTEPKSCPYLLSYITFSDNDTRNEFFDKIRYDVLNGNNNVTVRTSVNLFSKYYEYSTRGDSYKIMTLNKNSLLYASSSKEYQADIINIFQEFHYKYKLDGRGYQFLVGAWFISLFICVVSMWGVEKKIRNKGWISLIPFYNIGCLSKDVLGSPWYALLLLLPIGNAIFMLIFYYKMGKAFGKDNIYCVLLMFFPLLLWPLLAFDDSVYHKPQKKNIKKKNNQMIKNGEVLQETSSEKRRIGKIIKNIILWILTGIFLFFSFIMLLIYLEERIIGYFVFMIMFLIYSFMACPLITKVTKKYEKYTKFKVLIVVVLIIIHIIMFGILPL